ncbi:helix-turn-helix transcriptional regulator [Nonomuraea jabiensis]|uniref:ATP/maltotriose-dependent transcriptional regulator MalT n=1 Tax=Nonomuraea jabiensis TaxID=882448 RepID=A0A7W9LEH3_9ACTN|nr:LuxR family transcriptional regulator [Nonomuraea jabiensis]MBB5780850.1 ATP/maltotriose-dependent transcriptional regulator MalT [Nonomuraea jabiensis]
MTFVGRDQELRCLAAEFERARAGQPRLVVVEGPAGIGKTTLVQRFLETCGTGNVLFTDGDEGEALLPYGTLTRLLGGLPAQIEAPATAEPPDPLAVGAALLPELSERQAGEPLCLVVDDVHWADAPTLRALTFCLRRLRVDRVMAVLMLREAATLPGPEGLRRLIAADTTRRLRLRGLREPEVAALVGGRVSQRAVARLVAHTEGVPLHLRALLDEVPLEVLDDLAQPLPAPRSYTMLVLAKVARCAPPARELVGAVSVLGMSCPLHLAARVAGVAEPLQALEQAVREGVLLERSSARGPVAAFAHPLIRAAVYRDLGPAHRSALHARAALVAEDEQARLRHRIEAVAGPSPELAAELAELGRAQVRLGAFGGAAEHLKAAAELSGDPAPLAAEAVEALLLDGRVDEAAALTANLPEDAHPAVRGYALGHLAMVRGQVEEARAQLITAWEQAGPPESGLAARAAQQLAMLCLVKAEGSQAARWAERARTSPGYRLSIDYNRFTQLTGLAVSGEIDAALAATADLPPPASATIADLDALLGRGLLRTCSDDLAGGLADLSGVVAACGERSVPFRMLATAMLGQVEYRSGRWDDAALHTGTAASVADDADQRWLSPICHGLAALVPASRGDWPLAESHVRAAVAGADSVAPLAHGCSAAAHLAAARGDHAATVAALEPLQAVEVHDIVYEPGVVQWLDLFVDALVGLGELDRAETCLVAAERLAGRRGRGSALATAARCRGGLHAARHENALADAAFTTALGHSGAGTGAGTGPPFDEARLRLAYGRFLRRLGRRRQAQSHLELALRLFARLGAAPYVGRCEQELSACGLPRAEPGASPLLRLTPQEQAVARLVATGMTNRQVARELVLSVKTIEYHLGNAYAKLGVSSRVALTTKLMH